MNAPFINTSSKWLLGLLSLLIIAGLTFVALTHFVAKRTTLVSKSPYNISSSAKSKTSNSQSSSSGSSTSNSNRSDKLQSSTPSSSAPLIAPYGQFVSNHKPGQSGTPTQEQSVCNTTPGAYCYITFTNGNIIKQLDSIQANAQGVAIWNWDAKKSSFASGKWTIQAIATLNSQTKTNTDPVPLEIQ